MCDWTTEVYEVGGQLISIRLPKMGISAEICAGLGRNRNCIGVLLVTESLDGFVSASAGEVVYSVCAPEDEWNFWTGFEVAASRLRDPYISYPLLIKELRPLVEAAIRNKNSTPPESPSIIPAELTTWTWTPTEYCFAEVQLSEWDGGAYCTGQWLDNQLQTISSGFGKTRTEVFGRWLNKNYTNPGYRKAMWRSYYEQFPGDRKSGRGTRS